MIQPFDFGAIVQPIKILAQDPMACTTAQHYSDIGKYVDLNILRAQQWQLENLKVNPEYTFWGNGQDYMWNDNGSWDSPIVLDSVDELWELDDYNELVNFYFQVARYGVKCGYCDGTGLNERTKIIDDLWYSMHDIEWVYVSPTKRYNNNAWKYHLTEIEVEALLKAGRLNNIMGYRVFYDDNENVWKAWIGDKSEIVDKPIQPTPAEVNEYAIHTPFLHDSISRWICVKTRAKHLGVYGHCPYCNDGYIHTHSNAILGLQMWFLHPRKGASRGVYLKEIQQHELPIVINYLKQARDRSLEKFSKL